MTIKSTAFFTTLGAFFVALPAQAALLGSLDTSNLSDLSTAEPTNMHTLNPSGVTSLNTSIVDNGTVVVKRNNFFYFTDSKGLRRQKQGSTTPKTVRSGSKFSLITKQNDMLVVSNSAIKGKSAGSFLYDLTPGTVQRFQPVVGQIINADLARSGRTVAMIAKNAAGKNKVWLSQDSTARLREFSLPTGAKQCTDIALSPHGKTLSMVCNFKSGNGIVVTMINQQTIGKFYRSLRTDFSPLAIDWLTNSTLVASGYGPRTPNRALNPAYRRYTIANGRVKTSAALAIDDSAYAPAGTTIVSPNQIQHYSNTQFFYDYTYLGTQPSDATKLLFGSVIGYFDLGRNTNTVVVNDGQLNVLTEAHALAGS